MRVGRASAPGALESRFVSPIPPRSCRNKEQWRTVAARIDRHCSRLGASLRAARDVLTPSRDKGIAGGPFEYQPDAHRSPKEDDCSTDFPARRFSIHVRTPCSHRGRSYLQISIPPRNCSRYARSCCRGIVPLSLTVPAEIVGGNLYRL